jgi:hypothetical protein
VYKAFQVCFSEREREREREREVLTSRWNLQVLQRLVTSSFKKKEKNARGEEDKILTRRRESERERERSTEK